MEKVKLSEKSWYEIGKIEPIYCQKFEELWNEHPSDFGEVIVWGKKLKTPRYQQSYIRNYNFSGIDHSALPLPSIFQPYLERANLESKRLNHSPYNQVLINWYENGLHYIGKHRDDEVGLNPKGTIFSLSLGAERKFRIRSYNTSKIVKDLMVTDGTIVIMGGDMQKEFTHEIVKISGNKGSKVGKRINITCRVFN